MTSETFGETLRQIMTERGIGVRALARQVPCDPAHISRLRHGHIGISEQMAIRLDEILEANGRLADLTESMAARSDATANADEPDIGGADETPSEDGPGASGSPHDLLPLAWTIGKLDQPMDRRSVLQLAAAVTAAPMLGMADPIESLARALSRPAGIGEDLVTQMEARCVGLHRLEFVLPADQLFRALLAHLNEITSLLEAAPANQWRRRLARTAGESAVLGAWLAWDLGDASRAAALYRTARLAATEGQDPVIRVCSAIFQSFAVSETAGHRMALRTLQQAGDLLPDGTDRATRAWLMGRQAEESAALGDPSARDLIERASDLMADAHPQAERSWTRCLESPRFSHMRLTIATRLGDEDALYDEIGELAASASDPAQKKTGRMLASIGLALTRLGDVQEGIRFGERAIEAVRGSQAGYAMTRLTELGSALHAQQSTHSRELCAAINATGRELASPHPSIPGMTPAPN